MDRFAASLANALLGKDLHAPVLEIHFPAAQLLFTKPAIISITGAHFTPELNDVTIPMNHPVKVHANSTLKFTRQATGMRSYIGFLPGLQLKTWLHSFSTNTKAGAGGYNGRTLDAGDTIAFLNEEEASNFPSNSGQLFSAKGYDYDLRSLRCIMGSEWNYLLASSGNGFLNNSFEITIESDRMGYRLAGAKLEIENSETLLSSPVAFGTIQLLPGGQMIILMADHQTTGGYAKIAHVISADLPLLAQKQPGSMIRFVLTDLADAEKAFLEQQQYLRQVRAAVLLRS